MRETGNSLPPSVFGQYVPAAIYYEESDRVEYVRADAPAVYRRIDELLTLIYSLDRSRLVGFQIKGFRHFYLQHLRKNYSSKSPDFLEFVKILEAAISYFGEQVFSESEREQAYRDALSIAREDGVKLTDLPKVA